MVERWLARERIRRTLLRHWCVLIAPLKYGHRWRPAKCYANISAASRVAKSKCLTWGVLPPTPPIHSSPSLKPHLLIPPRCNRGFCFLVFMVLLFFFLLLCSFCRFAAGCPYYGASSRYFCCCSEYITADMANQQTSCLPYSTMRALASRNDIGSGIVSCIQMGG